jgi:hypothetical protein
MLHFIMRDRRSMSGKADFFDRAGAGCGLSHSNPLSQVLQFAIFCLKRAEQLGGCAWARAVIRATVRRISNHDSDTLLQTRPSVGECF